MTFLKFSITFIKLALRFRSKMTGDPRAEVTQSFCKDTRLATRQPGSIPQEGTSEVFSSGCRGQIQDLETTMFKSLLSGSVTTPLCRASRHRSPLVSCTSSSRTSSGHLAISRMALGDTLSRVNYLIPPNVMLMLSSPLLLPFTLNHLQIDIYVK